MRALYDSAADALAIDLDAGARPDHGDERTPGAVVHVLEDGRPVALDILAARGNADETLDLVAARHRLDREALRAAAHSALAAPDREVTLDVRRRR